MKLLQKRIFLTLTLASACVAFAPRMEAQTQRNIVIFVADGLRAGSVNPTDSPTMYSIRKNGVSFANSHAIFPTFTTPNASAIATGHNLGDTGDFSNTLYSGYPIFNTGNFGNLAGTTAPFVENDQVLADLNEHLGGNYLGSDTLMALARNAGYSTASVGKLGPIAIQDVSQLNPLSAKNFVAPQTVFIDDNTGTAAGVPLNSTGMGALTSSGVGTVVTPRNQPSGTNATPGTTTANLGQQQYFADAMTKAVLPSFVAQGKPFFVLYWSRDPDGSQHNQGDSLNSLKPGINGPTSRAAISNADANLKQIMDYINSDPNLAANTDIFVTADHGFATISKKEVDATGTATKSYAATFTYKDATGRQEVNTGFLPAGFLAIDLAHFLNQKLYDPDSVIMDATGKRVYTPVDPTTAQQTATTRQRPASGNGIIGGSGVVQDAPDGQVIIAANGGSDLIYVPGHNRAMVVSIVDFLSKQDYVSGVFADDIYGSVPGALGLDAIGLKGTTELPVPAIAVNFKTFSVDPANRLQSAVHLADSTLQEGQGMHGTLSRDNTLNNMAAIGPDFKAGFVDRMPVSNRDVPVTLAHILGVTLHNAEGRVLTEALAGGKNKGAVESLVLQSAPAANGVSTLLLYQKMGRHVYLDEACFVTDATSQAENPCVR